MGNEMSFEELQEILGACVDEVVNLRKENDVLKQDMKQLMGLIQTVVASQKDMVNKSEEITNSIYRLSEICQRSINNLPYENGDPRSVREFWYPKFHSLEHTIDMLVNQRCSMARYGDGEFAIMSGERRHKFQSIDARLVSRLGEVLHSSDEGFLVGIADNYGDLSQYNAEGKRGIRYYMTDDVREKHRTFLELDKTYHNAYISRPYAMWADNGTDAPRRRFAELQRIWDGRDVIFVEGDLTRMGVGNDLFQNAKSIRRIIGPATNAFGKYDRILSACLKHASKDTLFLIALGPTAGVLAYDLFKKGYQAVDIGHVDLEYEWMKNGTGGRSEVKTKYNNEYQDGDKVEDIHDAEYEKQIIARV